MTGKAARTETPPKPDPQPQTDEHHAMAAPKASCGSCRGCCQTSMENRDEPEKAPR